jgi:membrane fusion protein, peptide pheromone/bacteriocin exporter
MDLIPFSETDQGLESYLATISVRSRIIYYVIILVTIGGIAILPFIYVDVSVQARGYFQTEIEKQVLFSTVQGKVKYSLIKNGIKVRKGDTLLITNTESLIARKESLKQKLNENDSSIHDLNILTRLKQEVTGTESLRLLTKRYQAEYSSFRNSYLAQFRKFRMRQTEFERSELLYRQEIIPKAEFENSTYQLNLEKDYLNNIFSSQTSVWENDLTVRRSESANLDAELKQCAEDIKDRYILAPADGEIIQSQDVQEGSNVAVGQKLAELTPSGDLVVTCFVKPGDIGLIHENQHVKIQVDAFNFNQWGMLKGTITSISDDMITGDGSTIFFRVTCKPESTFLTLRNGMKAYVKKGMSLNTRIVVIRRNLFQLLFDKIDKWFNPYIKEPV